MTTAEHSREGHLAVLPRPDEKVAVFCGTRNVYDCIETAAKSLEYHTHMDRIYFLIEDDEFPTPLPDNVICMNVSNQKFFPKYGRNFQNAWTYMCLMRAAFAKVLTNEHKILSLDCDVVVNEDISELWDIDISDYFFAGVPEKNRSKNGNDLPYANFGVIMMNLDKIRQTKIDDSIIISLNRDHWGCPEQDAFNHFCRGHIYPLDVMYNVTRMISITGNSEVEKISHYAGIKYYKHFAPFRKYTNMSWEEIMKGDSGDE